MLTEALTIDQARTLVLPKLTSAGMPPIDADKVVQHLLRAERRGYSSHGLMRVASIVTAVRNSTGTQAKKTAIDLPGFVLVDGAGSQGIAAVEHALSLVKTKVGSAGAVVVGVTNYVGTTGCLGIYAAELADSGYASIMICHSEFGVAPLGSAKAVLGTNPITIGVPSGSFPFIGDIATSAWSYGNLKEAIRAGRRVPEGVVQTVDGRPSTDPKDADNGSQLPMAGHKGYALGLGIELLCGPLLGGKAGKDAVKGSDSFLGVIIRTDVARPKSSVFGDIDKLFSEIKTGPFAQGYTEVRIPGERSQNMEAKSSTIDIPKSILEQIRML